MFKDYVSMLKQEFKGYNLQTLLQDMLAGLTVAAVALPLALAFGVSSGADAGAGLITAIITGRKNGTVEHRAENLKIKELYQGSKNKIADLEEIMQKYNISFDEVAYMGDDTPDICILEKVALKGCPADAMDEVKKVANFVSTKNGGRGAVREFCDYILKKGI